MTEGNKLRVIYDVFLSSQDKRSVLDTVADNMLLNALHVRTFRLV